MTGFLEMSFDKHQTIHLKTLIKEASKIMDEFSNEESLDSFYWGIEKLAKIHHELIFTKKKYSKARFLWVDFDFSEEIESFLLFWGYSWVNLYFGHEHLVPNDACNELIGQLEPHFNLRKYLYILGNNEVIWDVVDQYGGIEEIEKKANWSVPHFVLWQIVESVGKFLH